MELGTNTKGRPAAGRRAAGRVAPGGRKEMRSGAGCQGSHLKCARKGDVWTGKLNEMQGDNAIEPGRQEGMKGGERE